MCITQRCITFNEVNYNFVNGLSWDLNIATKELLGKRLVEKDDGSESDEGSEREESAA